MIVLVHENHDTCKWPNITSVKHFYSGFDYANLVNSFRGSNYLQKLDSVMCNFSNMSTLNVLFEKKNDRRLGIGHIFRTSGDRCLL